MTHSYLPHVSIIIPIHNAQSTLPLCLESLRRLDYPGERIELFVIDNGSQDDGPEVARSFGANVLFETSMKSPYAARNRGIREAKGELIAFTDSDCVVSAGWLKHLTKEWGDRSVGCFAGEIAAYKPVTLVEKFAERSGILSQKETLACPYLPYTQTANSAYRKEVFEKIGLFIPDMVSGGDAEISWRMQRKTGLSIKFVPEALVYHRHRASIMELYRQFKKYEHGKILWHKYYPDYQIPSFEQKRTELIVLLSGGLFTLPYNTIRYLLQRIDLVDLTAPFMKIVISYGAYRARKEITEGSA